MLFKKHVFRQQIVDIDVHHLMITFSITFGRSHLAPNRIECRHGTQVQPVSSRKMRSAH